MAVLINCFILCVWQLNSVRPDGVSVPFTSITYKGSPINPKSLSLSFSINDSMDSKITNNIEDFKPIKTSTQEEELTKNMFISKLISQLSLISDSDSTPTNYNFSKQKQIVDPNILYKVAPAPQTNLPNLRTNVNEKYDLPTDLQNKKNTVNYNIKVISPPAVFNNLPYLPVTQNVADSKISETNKYLKNVPPTFLLPYPVRTPTDEDKQESKAAWQNVRKTFANNEDGTKYKIVEPLVQKNKINIVQHDVNLIPNMDKTEDILVPPKADRKCTYDLNINQTPFYIDSRSNKLYDYNCHQIPTKYLDTSYIQNHNILPTMSTHATDFFPKLSSPNLPEISKPQQIYTSDYDSYNFQLGSSLDNIVSYLKSILDISDNSATNSLRIPAFLGDPELLKPITDASVKLYEKPVFISTYHEVESPICLPNPNVDIPQKATDNATKKSINKSSVPYISSVTINYMPCIESSNEIIIFV